MQTEVDHWDVEFELIDLDLERRLYVSTEPETNELRDELNQAQLANDKLKKELAGSENRSRLLAVNLEESAKLYKNQVTEHVNIVGNDR